VSCSDDETIKLWGVKDKVKFDIVGESNSLSSHQDQIFKRIDVKNEGTSVARDTAADD